MIFRPPPSLPAFSRGFTIVEAVVVIVITGIIAGMVATFLRAPVDAYVDSARRAELTDIADTAVRRIGRDLQRALPNSVYNPGDSDLCIEFMPTRVGARYRARADAAGNGDPLDFTTTDDKFDMLALNSTLPATSRITAGDVVVVYNDGSASGNAYTGANAIQVASVSEPGGTANSTAITFVNAATALPFNRKPLPSESPANRFSVIPGTEHVVGYLCSGNVLYRYTRTLSGAGGKLGACPAAGGARLASNVGTVCSLRYSKSDASNEWLKYSSMVSISLEIRDAPSGESVKLYHQVHVDNTP